MEQQAQLERILFVGSNPSNTSLTEDAFHESTRSGKILASWVASLQGEKAYVNVSNQKTENNRPLTTSEIRACLPKLALDIAGATKVVALGKTAAKALSMLGIQFCEMPHPSGCNRLLNDTKYVEQKIKGMLEHCSPSIPSQLFS